MGGLFGTQVASDKILLSYANGIFHAVCKPVHLMSKVTLLSFLVGLCCILALDVCIYVNVNPVLIVSINMNLYHRMYCLTVHCSTLCVFYRVGQKSKPLLHYQ